MVRGSTNVFLIILWYCQKNRSIRSREREPHYITQFEKLLGTKISFEDVKLSTFFCKKENEIRSEIFCVFNGR